MTAASSFVTSHAASALRSSVSVLRLVLVELGLISPGAVAG